VNCLQTKKNSFQYFVDVNGTMVLEYLIIVIITTVVKKKSKQQVFKIKIHIEIKNDRNIYA